MVFFKLAADGFMAMTLCGFQFFYEKFWIQVINCGHFLWSFLHSFHETSAH